jgi:hypothetical protein
MKSKSTLKINTILGLFVLGLVVGCGGEKYASVPVTGIVTLDGTPLEGILVTFSPEPTESTSIVGPYSEAITDADGKFELKTRYGDPGAVVGQHRISFEHAGVDPEAMESARSELAEAKASDGDVAAAQAALDKLIADQKGRAKIPKHYSDEASEVLYSVPAGGASDVLFELKSK